MGGASSQTASHKSNRVSYYCLVADKLCIHLSLVELVESGGGSGVKLNTTETARHQLGEEVCYLPLPFSTLTSPPPTHTHMHRATVCMLIVPPDHPVNQP